MIKRTTHLLIVLGAAALTSFAAEKAAWENEAIGPVVNPIFFESPFIQTEARPIFAYHTLDKDFLGVKADVRLYALQLRYAVNDKLAIIATKDGYIELDPKGGKQVEGWADIGAGLKYALYRNDAKQLLITPGVTFEFPTGSKRVFQGNGDGEFNVFISAVKGWDRLHATVNLGGRIPLDMNDETAKLRYCAMLDYYTCRWFIPFVSINAFTTLNNGRGPALDSEGFDLINFGSSRAAGQTQAAAGVGFRSRLHKNVDLGFAYENGFAPSDDIFKDRYTVDLVWHF